MNQIYLYKHNNNVTYLGVEGDEKFRERTLNFLYNWGVINKIKLKFLTENFYYVTTSYRKFCLALYEEAKGIAYRKGLRGAVQVSHARKMFLEQIRKVKEEKFLRFEGEEGVTVNNMVISKDFIV